MAATECYIVHEIYNGENAQDQFEYELEQALEAQYRYIVIEPTRIGDETARWVAVGNCLHKSAVLAGAVCLLTPLALPAEYSRYVVLPAGALSLACAALYSISWQFDPCCKYQVEYDSQKLSRLPLHTLTSSSPVVLVRRDDVHRKRLHNTIALAALAYCAKKIYELYAVWALWHMHTHTHTDTDICTHTQTRSREVRSTTKHPTLADTHTHTKQNIRMDRRREWWKNKRRRRSLCYAVSAFCFQSIKDWTDGWEEGLGGACSSEWIFPFSLYFKSDITSALEPPFPLLPCACPVPSSSRRPSPNVTCHPHGASAPGQRPVGLNVWWTDRRIRF